MNEPQVQAANRAEVIETLKNYFKLFDNANVQASAVLQIEVITELFEYILGSINCRMYLLDPVKHNLFTIVEQKVAEFMAHPKAQGDNRFMTACRALEQFFQNGRILKGEQAARAPAAPAVPIVIHYADDEHVADLHAEQDAHDANLREWYDDEDEDEDDRMSIDTWISDDEYVRVFMNGYFDQIRGVADVQQKVVVAVELFAWIKANNDLQQNLLAPENEDLLANLNLLLDDLQYNPVLAAALHANAAYPNVQSDIEAFVAYGQRLIQQRYNPLPAAVAAALAKECRACDEPLEADEGSIGYCRDCAMCKYERE